MMFIQTIVEDKHSGIRRRRLLKAAVPMLLLSSRGTQAQQPIPVADMHSHFGFFSKTMDNPGLAEELRNHRVALVAWTLAGDIRWIRQTDTGIVQSGEPVPGALTEFFQTRFDRMRASVVKSGLRVVLSASDVDDSLAGEPGVVLAAEGGDFLEGNIDLLKVAFDKGLRHLQLVHYIRNPIGDFQTTLPTHNGLSQFGKSVVQACNVHGVLIDLAHSTGPSVDQALEISKVPMIWSHGWVDANEGQAQDPFGYLQRRLSLAHAKKIAAQGGVIGLWGLGLSTPGPAALVGRGAWTVGRQDTRGYARELASLVNMLGPDHVAIGTDIEGVGPNWSVNHYGHVRKVIDHLQDMKLPNDVVERIAYKNYARVLKAAINRAT